MVNKINRTLKSVGGIAIFVLLVLFSSLHTIQGNEAISVLNEPRLYVEEITIYDDHVNIQYEVNYPGFVELHLFDPEGEKIWIKGLVADKAGIHDFNISRKPMIEGKRYSFILKFKGKDYSRSFYNEVKKNKDSR